MEIKLPKEFTFYFKDPTTRAAFVSENRAITPVDCENCGGAGEMYIFVATAGPLREPPGSGKIAHYHNGKWYLGQTYAAICPACEGLGKKKEEPQFSVDPVKMAAAFDAMRHIGDD